MYLGITAVLAKSIARIHLDNLINFGIVPLILQHDEDYQSLDQGEDLMIPDLAAKIGAGNEKVVVKNLSTGEEIMVGLILSPRQREILVAGGLINWVKQNN